jgi:predicted Holliday junction resolvase-like endonuclease
VRISKERKDLMSDAIIFATLFVAVFVLFIIQKIKNEKLKKQFENRVIEERKKAIQQSRSTLEGLIYEQICPHLPNWKHVPSDARFLGSPIDFVVFDGISSGNPEKITIVEVKKGKSSTTPLQNKIKKLVKEGKIEWETFKVE